MMLTGIVIGVATLLTIAGIFEYIRNGAPEIPERRNHMTYNVKGFM